MSTKQKIKQSYYVVIEIETEKDSQSQVMKNANLEGVFSSYENAVNFLSDQGYQKVSHSDTKNKEKRLVSSEKWHGKPESNNRIFGAYIQEFRLR